MRLVLGWLLPTLLLVVNMWRARSFTIDDAYISFRYARNLADGLGLVYNTGERIEGYTNFLWTVLLGIGIRLNIDPELAAKSMGGLAACGSLGAVYVLSQRLRPLGIVPPVATWLMATSIVQTGYAMFGLETALFTCLVLWAIVAFLGEYEDADRFPLSGLIFGIAGLTRPEAPMYLGIPMLFLGRRFFARQNLMRGACFVAIVGAHLLWRYSYYGEWLPNTLAAKTGDLSQQLASGEVYLKDYARHTWPVFALAAVGVMATGPLLWRWRNPGPETTRIDFHARLLFALGTGVVVYVSLVGGDWMPFFRFLAPFEPFYFIFACVGFRALVDGVLLLRNDRRLAMRRSWVVLAPGLVLLTVWVSVFRVERLAAARELILADEKVFWDSAAGATAQWLSETGRPGTVALGDIGYVGYQTNYPILDLLGLVDPVISTLPGGYTQKTGSGYVSRVFEVEPRYFVFVGTRTCRAMAFAAQEVLLRDERFQRNYLLAATLPHSKGGVWCIFERTAPAG